MCRISAVLAVVAAFTWHASADAQQGNVNDLDRRNQSEIQEALIWAGFYDGMIDGEIGPRTRAAFRSFQQSLGGEPGRAPTTADIQQLWKLANREKQKVGFQVIRDQNAKVAIGIPIRLAPQTVPTMRGSAYVSSDGALKIDTLRYAPGERSMPGLFEQIKTRGPIKTVDYVKTPGGRDFVVAGRDSEKHYYYKAVEAPDGIFAFSVAHDYASKDQMSHVIVAMSNFFLPLSLLDRMPHGGAQSTPRPAVDTPNSPSHDNGNQGGSGTGFVVSETGHMITNAHVVAKCRRVEINITGSAPVAARVVAVDRINDLALLQANIIVSSVPRFRVGVRVGETINVFGFPLAGLLATSGNFTTGNVTALSGLGDDTRMLQISASLQPGNSGGAVLDQSGFVIGVIVSKLNAAKLAPITGDLAQNVNFAIKSSAALNFLETNGLVVQTTSDSSPRSSPDIAEIAKAVTVYVACH